MSRCTALVLVFAVSALGCSPGYVLRAGWEEAAILLRRERLEALIEDPRTPAEMREKFRLVLDARAFAAEIGLEPAGSYTKYSEIDRDVLVWVLSAAPKTKLEPFSWWFPFVGRIPYKGFFEREDAVQAESKLVERGLDTYLRPSPAMSTLGWFDDPLLSTVVRFDEVTLVDTVIHEILHNTVWVGGQVDFNESLANFVGAIGSQEFFRARGKSALAETAARRWHDERVYARFLFEVSGELEQLYADPKSAEEILARREEVFRSAERRWQTTSQKLFSPWRGKAALQLNNARIIADRIYLKRLELFQEVYEHVGRKFPRFLEVVRAAVRENGDAFGALERSIGKGAP